MLWQFNNVWDLFFLLIGIECFVWTSALIKKRSTSALKISGSQITCQLHCKLTFFFIFNRVGMLKKNPNHLRYICIYMVICQPCNPNVDFSKTYLCQKLFLSFLSLLRLHNSAICHISFSASNEQRGLENRGIQDSDAASLCAATNVPPPPDSLYLLWANATKTHLPNRWGTAALQDWLLASALKVSKAGFCQEFDARRIHGGLLPPHVHRAVSAMH